jgi:hypothetical protein
MQKLTVELLEDRLAGYNLAVAWTVTNLTYSYVGFVPAYVRYAVEAALSRWAAVAPLNFVERPDSGTLDQNVAYPGVSDPMIRMRFGVNTSPNVAYAYYPGPDGLNGDVYFGPSSLTTNFSFVSTHEIGHAIGIAHSDDRNAIMFPSVNFATDGSLSTDDVGAVRALYGSGTGSVTPIPRGPEDPFPPQRTPGNPFPGYEGKLMTAATDLNRDGILDTIFAAQGAQGHVKVFDGWRGTNELASFLAFPGFAGEVAVAGDKDTGAVVAQRAQGHVVTFGDKDASFIAYPGYFGEVSLQVNAEGVTLQALNHVKTYDGNVEVASYFV